MRTGYCIPHNSIRDKSSSCLLAGQQAQLVHLASKLHEASIGRLDVFAAIFGQTTVV